MANSLGCNVCYEMFEDILLNKIQAAKKIPPWIECDKEIAADSYWSCSRGKARDQSVFEVVTRFLNDAEVRH